MSLTEGAGGIGSTYGLQSSYLFSVVFGVENYAYESIRGLSASAT